MKPFETIYVDSVEVACDGGDGPLGHPRVFLHIHDDTGEIICPYCSRLFILKGAQARKAG